MKNQALFSSKDKSKKFKCRLLQFLFGALRVKESVKLQEIHPSTFKKKQMSPTYKKCIVATIFYGIWNWLYD